MRQENSLRPLKDGSQNRFIIRLSLGDYRHRWEHVYTSEQRRSPLDEVPPDAKPNGYEHDLVGFYVQHVSKTKGQVGQMEVWSGFHKKHGDKIAHKRLVEKESKPATAKRTRMNKVKKNKK